MLVLSSVCIRMNRKPNRGSPCGAKESAMGSAEAAAAVGVGRAAAVGVGREARVGAVGEAMIEVAGIQSPACMI